MWFSVSTWQQPVPTVQSSQRRNVVVGVARLVDAVGDGRTRVAVDGRTGAGKTSFGHELAHALAALDRPVFRASLDDFKRPWRDAHRDDRLSGEGYYRRAQDLSAIRQLLVDPAGPGGNGIVALCSIDPLTQVDHRDVTVSLPDAAVLIVDGVFAFRPELGRAWDLKIWLDVDPATSLRRGTERDATADGRAAAEALHRTRYRVADDLYLEEVDPVAVADVVIDNTDLDHPQLVRAPHWPGPGGTFRLMVPTKRPADSRCRARRGRAGGRGGRARCRPRGRGQGGPSPRRRQRRGAGRCTRYRLGPQGQVGNGTSPPGMGEPVAAVVGHKDHLDMTT